MPAGRPSDFTEELAHLICERMIEGESLRAVCRDAEMPHRSTVLRWLEADAAFAAKYARARELQADALFEAMQDVADDGNPEDIQRAKLRVATMQWRASKLAPKKYGDKVAHVGGGEDDAPIQHAASVTVYIPSNGRG